MPRRGAAEQRDEFARTGLVAQPSDGVTRLQPFMEEPRVMGLALDLGYATVLTAASPWLAARAARTGRYRQGWSQRLLGRVPTLGAHQSSIWFHGVSLGEVQLLRPLVEQFACDWPAHQVVLSTSTLTGMEVAQKSLPQTKSFYCPLDFSWAVQQALHRLRPRLIVLGELEVWPHLIAYAHAQQVPVAIINGRLSDRSFRGYQRFSKLLHKTFTRLSLVAAQDEVTAQRFRELGVAPERVQVTGSLKFDNVTVDRDHAQVRERAALVGLSASHRVLVVGSTQDPEEQAAIDAFHHLSSRFPKLKLVLVPRHPERFDDVDALLRASGLRYLRRSRFTTRCTADDWQVLLVDTVGELKWWWGLAEMAVVGGSFGSRGGQNMLEPAAYGAKVAFGPNVSNFRHIVAALQEKESVWQLPNLDALAPWIQDQCEHPQQGLDRGQRAKELVRSHQGATERTKQLLCQLLK